VSVKETANGFGISSWSDVTNVILILVFVVSGLTWGMKLEARHDVHQAELTALRAEITELQTTVRPLILPIAKERIDDLDRRIDKLEQN
jgi:hypothetical protein